MLSAYMLNYQIQPQMQHENVPINRQRMVRSSSYRILTALIESLHTYLTTRTPLKMMCSNHIVNFQAENTDFITSDKAFLVFSTCSCC